MHAFKITEVIEETTTASTFVLHPINNILPQYKAGQFITLLFNTRFGEKRRSYSISSSPDLGEPLSITIKRVANGEFSRLLVGHAKPGDILKAAGISGLFHLPDDISNVDQFFFLAAGSGITPCYSIIKTLLATTQKPIVLIYSNRDEADIIFYEQVKALQYDHPEKLKVRFLLTANIDVQHRRLSNWLLQQLLNQYLLTVKSKAAFYVCGPFDYMQMVNITLLSEGIPAANIRKENFNTLPRISRLSPPDKNAHQVTIRLDNVIHQLTVQYPASILAAAKVAHIPIPYSCEAGRCGSCVATCTKGTIWMAYNEVLLDEEVDAGRILCCQAFPINGDAEIVV